MPCTCSYTPAWITDRKVRQFCDAHDGHYERLSHWYEKIAADLVLAFRVFIRGVVLLSVGVHGIGLLLDSMVFGSRKSGLAERLIATGFYGLFLASMLAPAFLVFTLAFGWNRFYHKQPADQPNSIG